MCSPIYACGHEEICDDAKASGKPCEVDETDDGICSGCQEEKDNEENKPEE